MNKETARQQIRSSWRELLRMYTGEAKERVNGEASYICPICGHGKNGDGLTRNTQSKSGDSLKCFGCGFSGDIIDLIQQVNGGDYNYILTLLAADLGITIDDYTPQQATESARNDFRNADDKENDKNNKNAENGPQAATADYRNYYRESADRITDSRAASYLQARGISIETARAYFIGYDPAADPASAPGISSPQNQHPAPRIIIPTTRSHYIGRSIDDDTPAKFKKLNPARSKGAGAPGIFNAAALSAQEVQEVFVVEGAFDALAVLEVGAAAIAINSTSNASYLIKTLEEVKPDAGRTFVICLDNDDAGRKAAATLKEGMKRLNVSFIEADINNGCKDPNEALTTDRAKFAEAIEAAKHKAAARPDNVSYYISELMTGDIQAFRADIKTGFHNLDLITGGLYPGLYCLAAISSLGKTTFAHQLSDQIAAAGHEVLFFSMEQSRLEMASKSIARRTYINNPETAVSSLSIRKGYLPPQVLEAASQYQQEVQDRLSIIEGNFNCTTSYIGDYIRHYIHKTGSRPIIILDYLQVIQPEDEARRGGIKETIDNAIVELKRISREHNITIIAISSVNRSNYLLPIDFESLKESGGLEFTADVVWGLQLQCLNEPLFEKDKKLKEKRARIKQAKKEDPRKVQLVCLKNRYGISSYECFFNYYSKNDYFAPAEADIDFMNPADEKWADVPMK